MLDDKQDLLVEALFASNVQRSQYPTPEVIRSTVTHVIDELGGTRCAERVAEEFGEHPDTALPRMRWARSAVSEAYRKKTTA